MSGVWQGFGSFLLRDLPFDAFQFCIYEQLKIGYSRHVCTSELMFHLFSSTSALVCTLESLLYVITKGRPCMIHSGWKRDQ